MQTWTSDDWEISTNPLREASMPAIQSCFIEPIWTSFFRPPAEPAGEPHAGCTALGSPTASSSTSSSRWPYSAAPTGASLTHLFGHHPAPSSRRVDRPRGDGAAGPDCRGGLRPAHRFAARGRRRGWLHHQGACGGEMAGRSPVDRGKQGTKRSILVDAAGIPLGVVQAPANRNDSPLLASTLDTLADRALPPGETTVHLDRGYDSGKTAPSSIAAAWRRALPKAGKPAPLRATSRWVVERTNAGQRVQEAGLVHRTPRRGGPLLRRPGERIITSAAWSARRGNATAGTPPEALSMNASITYWRKL